MSGNVRYLADVCPVCRKLLGCRALLGTTPDSKLAHLACTVKARREERARKRKVIKYPGDWS